MAELADRVDEVDLVEGLGYVMTLLSDRLEHGSMRHSGTPVFVPGVTPTRKLFFDNPDADYDTALLSGNRRYRIRGTRGTVVYLAFCVYAGNIARGEPTRVVNGNDTDLVFALDGSFEVVLSDVEGPGNWIPLDRDANTVIARQYFLDRSVERRATYAIETIDVDKPDPVLDATQFIRGARSATGFVAAAISAAVERVDHGRHNPNRFVEVPGHGLYGTPDAGYLACWYELLDDQTLVIEGAPPRCARYWGLHLANRWGQSLDHRTRPTVLNARTLALEADGSFRVVVADTDPGGPNWLDTAGHREGWILFRHLLAEGITVPTVSVRRWHSGSRSTASEVRHVGDDD